MAKQNEKSCEQTRTFQKKVEGLKYSLLKLLMGKTQVRVAYAMKSYLDIKNPICHAFLTPHTVVLNRNSY